MIRIAIPTFKTYDYVAKQIEDIRRTMTVAGDVFATCKNLSASENRNEAIRKCKQGDILIMVDDDISGFYKGWDKDLTDILVSDERIIMTSARLLTRDGSPGPQIGAEDRNGLEYYEAHGGAVPSAAIAFKVDDLIFDFNYKGAGWEDTDFCRQKKLKYPNGQIVITNKCRLIHKLEFKHMGADTENAKYFAHKWQKNASIDCVIFSRDRAAQLDTLLESIYEYVPELHNRIHVLYSTTTERYHKGYDKVQTKYKCAMFHKQGTFLESYREIVNTFSKKYCLMMVDDGLFIRNPGIPMLLDQYTDDVCTASLRMSPTIMHCTPAKQDMIVPRIEGAGDCLKWSYIDAQRHMDWGYPHGVDGNIYRTEILKAIVNDRTLECHNPNMLEAKLIQRIPAGKPNMICGRQTSWVLISANRVSDGNTPHSGQSNEELNEAYLSGAVLDNKWRGEKDMKACNLMDVYTIKKPVIGVHFNNNGIMTGCWKVWNNTIKGLEKLGLPYSDRIEKYNGAINTFRNMPANTVVGPETMVLPRENRELWQKHHVHAVPCQWVKDSYLKDEGTRGNRIEIWPAGVETDRFIFSGQKEKERCIIFGKHINITEATMQIRIEQAEEKLREVNFCATKLIYGKYKEDDLITASNKAHFAIWISGTESQNIALLEVLSMNVPVYVWEQTEQSYGGELMTGLSNAPYFDERCGIIHDGMGRFEEFYDKAMRGEYKSREYVLEQFSLEKRAQQYYDIVTSSL
jgi:glycosyltransferase involved in cell wall biosynthesis